MESIIAAGLAFLAEIAPSITSSTAITSAIKFISAVLVPGIELAKEEIPVVKAIIATLTGNKTTTVDQMAQLDALDAQCDAALDAAIASAEAADSAASGSS